MESSDSFTTWTPAAFDGPSNLQTGDAPFVRNTEGLAERKGYDRQVSVQLGFLYADASGGSGMSSGDVALHTGEVQITAPTANGLDKDVLCQIRRHRRSIHVGAHHDPHSRGAA